jgi:hypothetical protein
VKWPPRRRSSQPADRDRARRSASSRHQRPRSCRSLVDAVTSCPKSKTRAGPSRRHDHRDARTSRFCRGRFPEWKSAVFSPSSRRLPAPHPSDPGTPPASRSLVTTKGGRQCRPPIYNPNEGTSLDRRTLISRDGSALRQRHRRSERHCVANASVRTAVSRIAFDDVGPSPGPRDSATDRRCALPWCR